MTKNKRKNKTRAGSVPARQNRDFILKKAFDQNVRFIRLWFSDIQGFLKSFAINIDELEETLNEGKWFDGSAIEGFARSQESDMRALPDANTFQILPWRPREKAVARMFADVVSVSKQAFEGDPRQCLKRNLEKAARMGYVFYVGPEVEFYYFKDGESTKTLDKGGYFDLTPLDIASDLRRETVLTLEELGIGVESSHHEVAPSQHEIDLRYTDALTMADNVMTYRLVVKEIAMKHGVYASFMPKPLKGENGNGMHVHQSLFKAGRNAFYDKKEKNHLSKTAKYYIAGLLKHAREICIVTNQWVNSYKRLMPGFEAPVTICWSKKNQDAYVRIPAYRPGDENAIRAELRSPDAACNPYLLFSVMLAAGLDGIKHRYELPDPLEVPAGDLSEGEQKKRHLETLPKSLGEAIAVAEESKFLKEALGEHIFHSLIENKKIEWQNYCAEITNYELDKYLPIL